MTHCIIFKKSIHYKLLYTQRSLKRIIISNPNPFTAELATNTLGILLCFGIVIAGLFSTQRSFQLINKIYLYTCVYNIIFHVRILAQTETFSPKHLSAITRPQALHLARSNPRGPRPQTHPFSILSLLTSATGPLLVPPDGHRPTLCSVANNGGPTGNTVQSFYHCIHIAATGQYVHLQIAIMMMMSIVVIIIIIVRTHLGSSSQGAAVGHRPVIVWPQAWPQARNCSCASNWEQPQSKRKYAWSPRRRWREQNETKNKMLRGETDDE